MRSPAPRSHGVALALLAAALAGACLVKDVELVPSFSDAGSGGNTSGAGSPSGAGKSSSSDGGEDAAAGDGSGGSLTSAGNGGGGQSGGMNPGGSGGMNPGGTAGMNQGGSNTPIEIPELDPCGPPPHIFCDNFEQGSNGQWPAGIEPENSPDAPSGNFVLSSDFQAITLPVIMNAVSISFWVKVESVFDQRIVSFRELSSQLEYGLGLELSRARWIAADTVNQVVAVAPEDDMLTRVLEAQQWFCIQIRADLEINSFESRVVVPGEPPFDLPVLDSTPTDAEDALWNATLPTWTPAPNELIFGQDGAYQQFDDVLIGDYDAQTLCDLFIASSN